PPQPASRAGSADTLARGTHRSADGSYPPSLAYEDGSSGVSDIWLTASYDGGHTWQPPILVNDNAEAVDELQPNLTVDAASGKVAVAFYDRRLACPQAGGGATPAGAAFGPRHPYGAAEYFGNTPGAFFPPDLPPPRPHLRGS